MYRNVNVCFDVLGWWFDACGPSNLNGMYYQQGQNSNRFNGIKWYYWKGSGYSLKSTSMMIRPADFTAPVWTITLRLNKVGRKLCLINSENNKTKNKNSQGSTWKYFTYLCIDWQNVDWPISVLKILMPVVWIDNFRYSNYINSYSYNS